MIWTAGLCLKTGCIHFSLSTDVLWHSEVFRERKGGEEEERKRKERERGEGGRPSQQSTSRNTCLCTNIARI